MKLVKPEVNFITELNRDQILKTLESIGRTCYKSEDKITSDSAPKFIKMIVDRGHLAMIEHYSISVRFTCDRGVSHEIVRHRLSSFAQESTRYCNYAKNKFDNQLTFILPCWFENYYCGEYELINNDKDIININNGYLYFEEEEKEFQDEFLWLKQMLWSEKTYLKLISEGWKPEQARSVLPNSLKTEIVMTANLRQWKLFFSLRDDIHAHPQMREVASIAHQHFKDILPEIYM